ncbi:MAG: HD domain-containing phosphohydrolase [Terriglobia bacterium]
MGKTGKFTGRALIVDDEPVIREILTERLGQEGYDCSACASGEEALDLIHESAFDVILSDLSMTGMSGMDLLDAAHRDCPRAAFILVTGTQDIRIGIEAMKQGASDYVTKPFQPGAVIRSVAQALEKKLLEREIETYRQRLEQMVEERTAQLQAALRRVEETYDATLEALGAALDLRDSATEGHSARVTRYTSTLAKAMGCTPEEMRVIVRGAYLHDIGKIGIPDGILLKQGRLTPEEMEVMETHVLTGYDLVQRIPFLAPAAEIVLTHQERYDGRGYPRGLKDGEIVLGSRIFAVADTLDAMTSDRPYRKALPLEDAIREIREEAGGQFDPGVVRVFLSIPETTWLEVREASPRQSIASKPPVVAALLGTAQPAEAGRQK